MGLALSDNFVGFALEGLMSKWRHLFDKALNDVTFYDKALNFIGWQFDNFVGLALEGLITLTKSSITDVWQAPKYAFDWSNKRFEFIKYC